jgi:hypothetical protein
MVDRGHEREHELAGHEPGPDSENADRETSLDFSEPGRREEDGLETPRWGA